MAKPQQDPQGAGAPEAGSHDEAVSRGLRDLPAAERGAVTDILGAAGKFPGALPIVSGIFQSGLKRDYKGVAVGAARLILSMFGEAS